MERTKFTNGKHDKTVTWKGKCWSVDWKGHSFWMVLLKLNSLWLGRFSFVFVQCGIELMHSKSFWCPLAIGLFFFFYKKTSCAQWRYLASLRRFAASQLSGPTVHGGDPQGGAEVGEAKPEYFEGQVQSGGGHGISGLRNPFKRCGI